MKTKTRILLYLPTKKITKNGKSPIYLRITVNGKRSEISTGIYTMPEKWNSGQIKGAETDNSLIAKMLADVSEIKNRFVFNNIEFTAETIKQAYLKKGEAVKKHTIAQLADEYFSNEKNTGKQLGETIRRYQIRLGPLYEFFKEKKLES